jgi:hypothetical protein
LWEYLVEVLAFSQQGWSLVTGEAVPAESTSFLELVDYFAELGRDGWELVSMTTIPSADHVVVAFKRPI